MEHKIHEKHGLTYIDFSLKIKRAEYTIWDSMRQRCLNPRHKAYKNYGGRGIMVCDKWLNSFAYFYEDMGDRPSRYHSLDRKENDKGYYKENCRWVTRVVQCNNRRSNVIIEFNGEKHSISEWAAIKKIGVNVLWERINSGWSVEKALTMALSTTGKAHHLFRGYYHTPVGIFESQKLAAKAEGLDPTQIRQRCRSNKDKWKGYKFVSK